MHVRWRGCRQSPQELSEPYKPERGQMSTVQDVRAEIPWLPATNRFVACDRVVSGRMLWPSSITLSRVLQWSLDRKNGAQYGFPGKGGMALNGWGAVVLPNEVAETF
jgi:hypothetical protein